MEDSSNYQIVFFSHEKSLPSLPESALNVPPSSSADEFNALLNSIAESLNETWQPLQFDFLINNALLRTTIADFAEANDLSGEHIIRIQCILREPAPQPDLDLHDSDWVADVKVDSNSIFSVNYGGELSLWSLEGKKILSKKCDFEALKCLDTLIIDKDHYVVAGGQNQTLTLYRFCRESSNVTPELVAVTIYRGHSRSIECVAAKNDGTRIVSGGFDNCLKVWNTANDENETDVRVNGKEKAKKAKMSINTKTPMVTLESHREAVVGVAWNPLSDAQVVTVSWDHTLALWDLELAGTLTTLSSNKAFSSLAVNSFNGLIITSSADPVIRMWDVRSKEGSMVKSSFLGHHGWVSDVCWSSSAEHLFVSSSFDKTVKMWDTRSPKAALYDMMGHEDRVLTVDWSPFDSNANKCIIASGGADGTLKTFSHSRTH